MKRTQKASSHTSRFALRADSGLFMGNLFPLTSGRTVIGRNVEVGIPVDDTKVSRSHAAIDFQAGHPVVVDLGSTNGTYVNGVRVENLKRVTVGDKIRIGSAVFILELFDEAKQKLKKTWKAPTQAILRKNIASPATTGVEQMPQPALSKDSTGIRWQWLLDHRLWAKDKKTMEPWLLGLLCVGLLAIALWL